MKTVAGITGFRLESALPVRIAGEIRNKVGTLPGGERIQVWRTIRPNGGGIFRAMN
jgi:hypothetical protein